MCIRDRVADHPLLAGVAHDRDALAGRQPEFAQAARAAPDPVSYTHLRAHETVLDLVCRLLLEKKKIHPQNDTNYQT